MADRAPATVISPHQQARLQEELRGWGICTESIDRCVQFLYFMLTFFIRYAIAGLFHCFDHPALLPLMHASRSTPAACMRAAGHYQPAATIFYNYYVSKKRRRCRFIVTQQRQAVEVRSPTGLVRHLEALVGGAHFEAAISDADKNVAACEARAADLQAQLRALQREREALAPHVDALQRYQKGAAELRRRRCTLLQQQEALLAARLEDCEAQVRF